MRTLELGPSAGFSRIQRIPVPHWLLRAFRSGLLITTSTVESTVSWTRCSIEVVHVWQVFHRGLRSDLAGIW